MKTRLRFLFSLQAQLILLMLATIFFVQAITLGTANYYQRQFTETVTVEVTATTIRTLRAALAEIPSNERAEFVRLASKNQWHLWTRKLPSEAQLEQRPKKRQQAQRSGRARHATHHPPSDNRLRKSLRQFVDALNLKLDDDTRVGLLRGSSPRLYISLVPDQALNDEAGSQDWLVIPLDQLAPPFPVPMAVIWLSAMGLLLLCSAGFSWHITRPLRHLANAADQLAAGKPERVNPSGPQETRSLAQRFNAMLDALAQEQAIRSTLLAGLPHDLKGPLSRMWLRTEMLDDDAVKKGLLDDIQDMQRMVNQFIEFVRGSDRSSYHFETMDIDEWLAEKIKTWQDTGSEIDLNRPATPLRLNADATALGRLLDNLITNALNHGKPPVNVTLEQHKNRAQISVSDHGSGIAAEQYNEALRPFSRLDEARTRTGSVGLGLALCQAIAEAHGGSLRLSTATSGGLNVIVSLPLSHINS